SWMLFTQFKKDVANVLGATLYSPPGGKKNFLYLFVTTNENNQDAIEFTRFDLQGEGRWSPADAEQLDTQTSTHFTADLLITSETTPPAVRITPQAGNPFQVQLGVDGMATNVQITQAATPVT